MRQTVLLVEDNPGDVRLIHALLRESADGLFDLHYAHTLADALDRLDRGGVHVVLLDLGLPDSQGASTLLAVRERAPRLPIVVLSGQADGDLGLQAVHAGAQDYLVKGRINGDVLRRVLRYAVERARLQTRLAYLAETSGYLAGSLDYADTLRRAARVAVPALADEALVLILDARGERLSVSASAPTDTTRPATGLESLPELREALASRHASRMGDRLSPLWPHLPEAAVVPLVARERLLGALVLGRTDPEPAYDAEDLVLADLVASRAALAIDNARLYSDLDRTLHSREAFYAAASHDLRNPLAKIKLYTDLLEDAAASTDPDDIHDVVQNIDGLVDRSLGLINELLDIARLETGQPLPLQASEVDLVRLARAVVDEHARSASHQLSLDAEVDELVGMWDAARLGRVLDNLLSNAIKYSPGGSPVVVRVRLEAGAGVVDVVDRGIGIPAADLPRIFERFHRAANARTHTAGHGLGLWAARQIVEQHGGTLGVESELGAGTTLRIRLPLDG